MPKTKKKNEKSKAPALVEMVPVRTSQVLARTNSDGSVAIIRLDSDRFFFTLDGISAEFWNQIDGKTRAIAIAESMIKKHDLPSARFLKDINKLLSDLLKEKLIQQSSRVSTRA